MSTLTRLSLTKETIVDFIADIFRRRGAESYLGEQVSMSEHMLQAAAAAAAEDAGDVLIAATLLHDIGHYTGEFPEVALARGQNNFHETAGAAVLAPFFPPAVTEPIRLHVAAKRYLCASDPAYLARLSPASVHTLNLQGGSMSEAEAAAFRQTPYVDEAVRVRQWDDAGKVAGLGVPPFEHYLPLLRRIVERQEF
jgi:phosphonate degradation associated HDIG domain protein